MKCINCGRNEAEIENLCIDCFLKVNPIIKKVKPFVIKKCVKCGSIYDGHQKIKNDKQLEKIVVKHLVFDNHYCIQQINVAFEELDKEFVVNLEINAVAREKSIKDKYELDVKKEKFVCPMCSKKVSKYFEGILQVLTHDEQILRCVEKLLEKEKIPVNQKKMTRNGFEYYVIDKTKIKRIGNKLVELFGGFIKESASMHTKDRQTSKEVYRLNISYKPLKIKKGEVFFYNSKVYKLLTPGKTNKVLDIFNLKETRIKNGKYIKLLKQKARVVSKRPLKVLSEKCQLITVRNPMNKEIKLNSIVKIVEFDGEYFIVD